MTGPASDLRDDPGQRFATLVAGVLGIAPADLTDTLGPGTHDGWTSLRHVQLVVAAEDEYGVTLSRQEIRAIRSVGDLRRILADKEAGS